MAWTESDRVKIRKWLGSAAVFVQANLRIETAITSVLSIADGGSRPDSSTETIIRGYLTQLDGVETQWLSLLPILAVNKGDGSEQLDALRGLAGVKKIGRMYVGFIIDALGLKGPVTDVFSSRPPMGDDPDIYRTT